MQNSSKIEEPRIACLRGMPPQAERGSVIKTGSLILAALLLAGCATVSSTTAEAPKSTGPISCEPGIPDLGETMLQVNAQVDQPQFCLHPNWIPAQVEQQSIDSPRVLAIDISGRLAASMVQLGLANRLVGRDISSDQPELSELPLVTGSAHALSLEAILAVQPDLVLTDGTLGPRSVLEKLESAGVQVLRFDSNPSLSESLEQHREIAELFGRGALAEVQLERARESLAELAKQVDRLPAANNRAVFLYLRGGGLMLQLNPAGPAGELLRASGLQPIADDGEVSVPDAGLPISPEALLAMNPDYIVVMTKGLEAVQGVDGMLRNIPGLIQTNAGKNRAFLVVPDEIAFRFGPWAAATAEALARQYAKQVLR